MATMSVVFYAHENPRTTSFIQPWATLRDFVYSVMLAEFYPGIAIHTFLVMIQGSLIYQKIHLNKYWRLLLECWVWFHGFSIAVMVSKEG